MYFIGDVDDTLTAIVELLSANSWCSDIVDKRMTALDQSSYRLADAQDLAENPFFPYYIDIPGWSAGFSYIAVNYGKDRCRVGTCVNLKEEIRRLNGGIGDEYLEDPYDRPFSIQSVITGYPGSGTDDINAYYREEVDRRLRNARNSACCKHCCYPELVDLEKAAIDVVNELNLRHQLHLCYYRLGRRNMCSNCRLTFSEPF